LKEGPAFHFTGDIAKQTLTATIEVLNNIKAHHCYYYAAYCFRFVLTWPLCCCKCYHHHTLTYHSYYYCQCSLLLPKAGQGFKEKYMTSEAMLKIKKQLPLLCQHTVTIKKKEQTVEKVLTGEAAATAKLLAIKDTTVVTSVMFFNSSGSR
jgi:hypothetical protein